MAFEMPTSVPLESRSSSMPFRTVVLYGGFVLTGMITTLLGPILPYLASRWNLDDSRSGLLFTAQFAGTMLGVLVSSWMHSRLGPRASLASGYAAMGTGVAAVSINSWAGGMFAIGCFGFGLGLIIPTTNMLVSDLNPHRRAASLSTLNMTWGLGAVLWPLLAAVVVKFGNVLAMLISLGATAIAFCFLTGKIDSRSLTRDAPQNRDLHEQIPEHITIAATAALGLLFFLYVGTENCFGGWVASLAHCFSTAKGTFWALMPSFFWGGLLLGRALAPFILRRIREIVLVRGCLLLALTGALVISSVGRYSLLVAGISLSGLGLSAVFPITISQFSLRFGKSAIRFMAGMFALAGLGGATLPWMVGILSNRSGSLQTGILVPVVSIIAMLALYIFRFTAQPDTLRAR